MTGSVAAPLLHAGIQSDSDGGVVGKCKRHSLGPEQRVDQILVDKDQVSQLMGCVSPPLFQVPLDGSHV